MPQTRTRTRPSPTARRLEIWTLSRRSLTRAKLVDDAQDGLQLESLKNENNVQNESQQFAQSTLINQEDKINRLTFSGDENNNQLKDE